MPRKGSYSRERVPLLQSQDANVAAGAAVPADVAAIDANPSATRAAFTHPAPPPLRAGPVIRVAEAPLRLLLGLRLREPARLLRLLPILRQQQLSLSPVPPPSSSWRRAWGLVC